ncbi:ABC transporter substrate-binding protein [Qingshengfaniella alkalisoli]|uniref:ABC transporter substrate-binding protein n=1 Tax=Qingshengfaniella alkalisoli TaxID=2599296 RepID=A0A5B8J891_9RHOB|nr:ABC transporter substrate-binding protein [Qingshengfaniella alkalisoli]QDY70677.1 ABC transporter substrate-binding protein [Qingshengfaniella alkalisoli]
MKTCVFALTLGTALASSGAVMAQDSFKIGVPVFLSGAAAGPFGEPEKQAAELLFDALNAGEVPGPYNTVGINGRTIEARFTDEASDAAVEYRNLVERDGVDAVIGYTSSGNCKTVAPLAEELETFTVFVDCGTPQIFEEVVTDPKFLFRTGPTATSDAVGAARYLVDSGADLSRVAGINQNYAWGQDNWRDFTASLKALDTGSEIVSEQFPQLGAGQYGAEVSALLTSSPTVVFNSFWGGDLEAFVLQSAPRGLFARSTVLMTCGEALFPTITKDVPEGAIVSARGPFSVFAPENELSTWFSAAYEERFGTMATYPAWKMAQAILGAKAAFEKAGEGATGADAAAAFAGMEFEAPSGTVKMANANGHQAIQGIGFGTYALVDGEPTVENVKFYEAECTSPPADMTAAAWIEAGFEGAICD